MQWVKVKSIQVHYGCLVYDDAVRGVGLFNHKIQRTEYDKYIICITMDTDKIKVVQRYTSRYICILVVI